MEVHRNPAPPTLNSTAIELLTELCFRKDDVDIPRVDGIFVFSSSVEINQLAKLIEDLIRKEISDKLFLTGGNPTPEVAKDLGVDGSSKEADLVLDALEIDKLTNVEVFVEDRSNNTLDNVSQTFKNPKFAELDSLVFVFKSHSAGRGYLTLRKFFPSQLIYQKTFDTKYNNADKAITKQNWHAHDFGKNRVWGEFLRIKKYGERGDIAFDAVTSLVSEINRCVIS